MKLGFIGLGRMGKAMVLHLLEEGVDVVVYNRTPEKTDELKNIIPSANDGSLANANSDKLRDPSTSLRSAQDDTSGFVHITPTYNIRDFVYNLSTPRVIWLMVEHGKPVDEVIESLIASGLDKGDIIIDGGNSFYKDSVRRFKYLKEKGIHFLDIGTSGGLEGAREGACLMIGGDISIYNEVQPLFRLIAGEKGGYAYFGSAGAGHFVKMVHNGVEYGMLQAIGEGFEILEKGPYQLDFHKVSQNWNKGSVVRGWLMELLEKALAKDSNLEKIEGVIGGGSTGSWTLETAKELKANIPVIAESMKARERSTKNPSFSGKVVAALRYEFGGHEIQKKQKVECIK